MIYKILQFYFLLAVVCTCTSVSAKVENDLGLWTPIYINIPATKKVKTNFEINPRIQENVTDFNQLIIRPSIGYYLTDNLSVWQGYAWVTNYIPDFVSEQRIWQQLLHEKEFNRFKLSNRFRFEERFIDNINGVPLRTRYMFRSQIPFTDDKKWSFVFFDEVFVNLNSKDSGPKAGIDQNRFFVGLNRKFSKSFNAEGGYLMQYINIAGNSENRLNHNILVNFYFDTPQLFGNN